MVRFHINVHVFFSKMMGSLLLKTATVLSKVIFAKNFSAVLCDTTLSPMKNTQRICVSVTYHNLRPLHTL